MYKYMVKPKLQTRFFFLIEIQLLINNIFLIFLFVI